MARRNDLFLPTELHDPAYRLEPPSARVANPGRGTYVGYGGGGGIGGISQNNQCLPDVSWDAELPSQMISTYQDQNGGRRVSDDLTAVGISAGMVTAEFGRGMAGLSGQPL